MEEQRTTQRRHQSGRELLHARGQSPTPAAKGRSQNAAGQLALFCDNLGDVYFTDSSNSRVMKVTPGGTLTVLAGNGVSGFSGDEGLATNA